MSKKHEFANASESKNRLGRPPATKSEHATLLQAIVAEHAQASLEELAGELHRRSGLLVCAATIRRHLRAQGIVRLKAKRRPYVAAQAGKRYGYTTEHRRDHVGPYSTSLTDAEWELIADLFERDVGTRGTPPRYGRRDLEPLTQMGVV